jgi:glycosyltransferase involved in cell wall biosynthesis
MALRIAVIIPAYNAEAFIEEALDSVGAQTRAPDQVIVVDDGSTDSTADRVRGWKHRTGVRVEMMQQGNMGIATARNSGIRRARTELIALLDADDIWEPHHLERSGAAFEQEPELALCFANHQKFNTQGVVLESFLSGKALEELPFDERALGLRILGGPVYCSLVGGNYIPPSTSVFCKAAADRIGLFDPAIKTSEDRDFFLRLTRVGRFAYYPDRHARYRLHDDNISHPSNALTLKRHGLAVLVKMLKQADDLELTAEERARTREAALRQARGVLYAASLQGFPTYARAAAGLLRSNLIGPVLNPKHLVRSLSFQVRFRRT